MSSPDFQEGSTIWNYLALDSRLCQHRASLGPNTSQEEVYLSSLAPLLTTFMDMDVEVRGRGATPPLTTS